MMMMIILPHSQSHSLVMPSWKDMKWKKKKDNVNVRCYINAEKPTNQPPNGYSPKTPHMLVAGRNSVWDLVWSDILGSENQSQNDENAAASWLDRTTD